MKKFYKIIFLFVSMFACINIVNADVTWKYVKSPKYKTELKEEFKKIPKKAKNVLNDADVTITLYGNNYFPQYVGLFNGNVHVESYKMNWLNSFYKRRGVKTSLTTKELSTNYAKCTLIHELGHAFDYNSGWLSKTKEFKKIYKAEKEKIKKTKYYKFPMGSIKENVNNPQEYFATAFTMYVRSKKDFKKHCPKTYKYFEKLFK